MRFDNDMSIFQILKSRRHGKYLKSSILWDITQRSSVKVNQRFEKEVASIFRVEQLPSKRQVQNRQKIELASILFGNILLGNVGGLHGVLSQKT
jgi:hypothetical protein